MKTIDLPRLVLLACIATSSLAHAATLDELAARGAVVASADPLAVELRSRAPDDSVRRGFDIGMAAAEGNTAPGPGKQKIHDSLPAAEQGGYDTAVSFSLQRNRNAKLAATGASIAAADPVVAQARTADGDVSYEELRCRGGAGLRFDVNEGRTNSSGEATSYVVMRFNPSPQPADATGLHLQPGQCSFPTRAVDRHEPTEVFIEMLSFGQLKQQLHGTPVDNSPTAAQRYPDAQNVPRYLADPKHYWSFFVSQGGNLPFAWFVTEYVGRYWIPGLASEYVVRPVDTRRAH